MITKTQILIAFFATASFSGAVAGDSLEQRVATLEARVKQLEQHLATESDLKVALPKATKSEATEQKQIVINVAADGTFSLAHEQFDLAGLSAKLKELGALQPKPAIIIRAGKDTDYKHITDILDACKAAGLVEVAFATATPK